MLSYPNVRYETHMVRLVQSVELDAEASEGTGPYFSDTVC